MMLLVGTVDSVDQILVHGLSIGREEFLTENSEPIKTYK